MNIRIYLRRSKNDEGKQQFSLDVQRNGCLEFIARLGLTVPDGVIEYIDDGKAGDDFHTREGIRRLLAEVQAGDVIVCRDQSRLGRDALEVTLVIRDLIRDHGCRLFYYTTGQEVQFASAIDQVTTFIQGTGHQMELEAIRSRTREALRSRVRNGRVAGGRCYGYRLERKRDSTGRPYTVAIVDKDQAPVVQRIYDWYLMGRGLKWIATRLNQEGVPSPTVGRRGSGSWAPSGIRAMLQNPRYRGLYIHGKVKTLRRNGRVERINADPRDMITLEIPEWRIVDDETWFAVQEIFQSRAPTVGNRGRPAVKHPLSGIARCAVCGGSIGSAGNRSSRNGRRVTSYACLRHHTRGESVCPVSIYQTSYEVEAGLLSHLREHVLTPSALDAVRAQIRQQLDQEMAGAGADTSKLTRELRQLRAEQKRLAKAIAMVDSAPELLSELNQRRERIRYLEAELAAARRTPDDTVELVAKVEAGAREKLEQLGEVMLDDRVALRELFLSLFPEGLIFKPSKLLNRRVWAISGTADLGGLNLRGDPNGI